MENPTSLHDLLEAMKHFRTSYHVLLEKIGDYECFMGRDVNALPGFTETYPFGRDLQSLPIDHWVDTVTSRVAKSSFKVLNYEYLNTGGNTMVGIFTVWIPALHQTVYALTNEEGCSLTTVDYISHDIEIEDYDEIMIDRCEYDGLSTDSTYFELYRYCLNEYTKSDCKYFGCTRELPYYLLSYELRSKLDMVYLEWCEENNRGLVATDGYNIIVSPDYDDTVEQLQDIKAFKDFHDTTAGVEDFYNEEYVITFAGRTIRLPFMADVWDAIDEVLKTTIENW